MIAKFPDFDVYQLCEWCKVLCPKYCWNWCCV